MTAGERGEAGEGAQGGGLSGAVGSEEGDDVTGGGGEGEIQAEAGAVDYEVGVQAVRVARVGVRHEVVIQRSRNPARTAIDTASRTRLRAIAASGSFCRAR